MHHFFKLVDRLKFKCQENNKHRGSYWDFLCLRMEKGTRVFAYCLIIRVFIQTSLYVFVSMCVCVCFLPSFPQRDPQLCFGSQPGSVKHSLYAHWHFTPKRVHVHTQEHYLSSLCTM